MFKKLLATLFITAGIAHPAYSGDVFVKDISKGPVALRVSVNQYNNYHLTFYNKKTKKEYEISSIEGSNLASEMNLMNSLRDNGVNAIRKIDYSNLKNIYILVKMNFGCAVFKTTWEPSFENSYIYQGKNGAPDYVEVSCSANNIKVF